VKGRPLAVPRAAPGIAGSLSRICAPSPLGRRRLPRDRRSLCWVIVEGIPRLFSQQRNEARRFNILIDALYEARTLVIASADVPPEQLYTAGDGTFEFRRTASRLIEGQSEEVHH
jgi:cell division protein ZapE